VSYSQAWSRFDIQSVYTDTSVGKKGR
jgi:hypothetical protein